jgi:hypothetical protein
VPVSSIYMGIEPSVYERKCWISMLIL